MRPARMLATLALFVAVGPTAWGQTTPYDSTVAVPEVEVRSGPTREFYPTGKLHLNDRVRVLEEKDGWFKIAPPAGSFSWIRATVIDRTGRTAVVMTESPVRIGSSMSTAPPSVEQVKVPRGSQVIIMGEPYIAEDGSKWWPIQPPPQEGRFVPKEAVRTTAAVETVAAAPPQGTAAPDKAWPTPVGVATGTAPVAGDSLWAQAEQAEKAGNAARAVELYTLVYRQNIENNHKLAMDALNRIHFLNNGNYGSVPPGYQPGIPAEAATGQATRLVPLPTGSGAPTVPAVPAVPASRTNVSYPPLPPPAQTVASSGPGRLRRAGFFVDGKQAYVLENSQGRPQLYVTAQTNISLEAYVNRAVELYGPMVYRGDLRTNYMTASQVNLLPGP